MVRETERERFERGKSENDSGGLLYYFDLL